MQIFSLHRFENLGRILACFSEVLKSDHEKYPIEPNLSPSNPRTFPLFSFSSYPPSSSCWEVRNTKERKKRETMRHAPTMGWSMLGLLSLLLSLFISTSFAQECSHPVNGSVVWSSNCNLFTTSTYYLANVHVTSMFNFKY